MSFERYQKVKAIGRMEVGEIQLMFGLTADQVHKKLNRHLSCYRNRSYSWDTGSKPIAIRRDS